MLCKFTQLGKPPKLVRLTGRVTVVKLVIVKEGIEVVVSFIRFNVFIDKPVLENVSSQFFIT
jgi:hypothetical protein